MKQILKRGGKKREDFYLNKKPHCFWFNCTDIYDSSYVSTLSVFSTSMQHVPGALSEMVKGGKEVHVC